MSAARPLRVLVVEAATESGEQLRRLLSQEPWLEVVEVGIGARQGWEQAQRLRPDVVLVEVDLPGPDGISLAERVIGELPGCQVVLMSASGGMEVMRRAMLTGAREFLNKPLTREVLLDALQRARTTVESLAPPAEATPMVQRRGKIILVYSPRGGTGCTTIACNLAAALSILLVGTDQRVALIDARPQFGDVGLAMGIDTDRSLLRWPTRPEDLGAEELEEIMLSHWSRVRIMLAPAVVEAEDLERRGMLLQRLADLYDYVVVDAGHAPEDAAALWGLADRVILVLNPEVTSLKNVGLLFRQLHQVQTSDKLLPVLNKAERRGQIKAADVEARLGLKLAGSLTLDRRVVAPALDLGIPFVLSHPESRATREVFQLALPLVPPTAVVEPPKRPLLRMPVVFRMSATVLIILGALGAGLVALLLVMVADLPTTRFAGAAPPSEAPAEAPAAKLPAVGEVVRDRSWEFTVLAARRVPAESRYFAAKPSGSYLAVDLRLRNISQQRLTMQERDFRVRDGKGALYPVSPEGSLGYFLKARVPSPFTTFVEPEIGINTAVVFDVPPDARGFVLLIRSGPFADEHLIDLKQ